MDQKSSLLLIAQAKGVLETLLQEHVKLQSIYARVQLGDIPDTVFENHLSKSFSEVQEIYLEDLPLMIAQNCARMNLVNDLMDKVDPPPAIYFKRQMKRNGCHVSFDPQVSDPVPAERNRKNCRKRRNPYDFISQWVNSLK